MQQEFGAVVQRDVNRIASIVENVAAFAESNKGDMTAGNLPDVLKTVADIVHPELLRAGVTLDLPAVDVPPIRGNTSQLLQVILNLTQNAIQALEGRPDPRISFRLETRVDDVPQPLLFVSVEDNGRGIDPAVLTHIFEPFTTTQATGDRRGKQGMGLGLAIVKRIVQHHHGDIDVDSTVGVGTAFRVHLPVFKRPTRRCSPPCAWKVRPPCGRWRRRSRKWGTSIVSSADCRRRSTPPRGLAGPPSCSTGR